MRVGGERGCVGGRRERVCGWRRERVCGWRERVCRWRKESVCRWEEVKGGPCEERKVDTFVCKLP